MRVLHVIHSLSGGGAERQLLSLMDTAARNGIEMAVFCVRSDDAYLPVQTLYQARSQQRWNLGLFSDLRDAVKHFKPHIVHVWLPPAVTIPAMVVATLMRIPIIFSYRNAMSFHRALDLAEYALAMLFSRRVISNTRIGTCAPLYRLLYRRKYGAYIPNSVQIPQQKSLFASSRPIKELIFVGRITYAKNWEAILQAVGELKHRNDWKLSIYGSGEDEPSLQRQIITLGLQNKVFHYGFSDSIYDVMINADAMIFPSRYEGMPNVLLEALATGLYIIASDIPANRQVVGNADCLSWFPTQNSQKLRACIEEFLDNQIAVDTRCRNGLSLAKQYSREATLRMHLDTYETLLNQGPQARKTAD